MLKKLTSLIFFALVLVGCAGQQVNFTQPAADAINQPSERKALIYFFRAADDGSQQTAHIFEGSNYIGSLKAGEHFTYTVNNERHVFMVTGDNADIMSSRISPNKTYYVRIQPKAKWFQQNVYFAPYSMLDPAKQTQVEQWLEHTTAVEANEAAQTWAEQTAEEHDQLFEKTYRQWLKRQADERTHLYKEDGL